MKTVFNNDMVAHVWAQQTQDEGRNAGESLYFKGPTLFSYAEPIARFVEHKGKRAVLLTSRTFSITTTGHGHQAWSAIPDRENTTVFHVHNLGGRYTQPDHEFNFRDFCDRLGVIAGKLKRARANRDWYLREFGELVEEANTYAKFFGLRKRVKTTDAAAYLDEFNREKARLEAAERKRLAEAKRKYDAELAERVELWKAGGETYIGGYSETLLRIVGDELQTSRGARVPLDHARKAFPAIFSCRKHGRSWERNGQQIRVGHFQIDSIDAKGNIKAGCHRIEWSEIERIARQLDLIPAP